MFIGIMYLPDLSMMDMPADYILVFFFYGQVGSGLFKLIDKFYGVFKFCFFFLRKIHFLAAKCCQKPVGKAIQQYQGIIAYRTQFSQPFRMLHGHIKYITMKYPRLL